MTRFAQWRESHRLQRRVQRQRSRQLGLQHHDAPELCECQRPVSACECRQLFAAIAR
jgi:hypothetical protein